MGGGGGFGGGVETRFFAGDTTAQAVGFETIWNELSPRSTLGRVAKNRFRPFAVGDLERARQELQAVDFLKEQIGKSYESISKITAILENLKDPGHAIAFLRDGQPLRPAEIFVVAHLAFSVGKVLAVMEDMRDADGYVWPQRCVPPSLVEVEEMLLPGASGQPVFYVGDGYSPELAKVRTERRSKERALRAEMNREAYKVESVLGRRIGIKEEFALRKSNSELIEKARLMPELGETRETITHVYFRLKATSLAVRLEREINRLRQRETTLEDEILKRLSQELMPNVDLLDKAATALGELDFLISKAELAREWNATIPLIRDDSDHPYLTIEDAIHPIYRREVEARGGTFQGVTVHIDSPVTVITGPNMGGKTVALATAGLMVSLAQWGLPVPCRRMEFSLYNFVYFHEQAFARPGLSSFAAEIEALKELFHRQRERGLILLDEVGRGTNPEQGLALYAALLSRLKDLSQSRSTVVATTHFNGLAALLNAPQWQVRGLTQAPPCLSTEDLSWLYEHMDYRLQKVGPDTPAPRDALTIARLLGLDTQTVQMAEQFYRLRRSCDGGRSSQC